MTTLQRRHHESAGLLSRCLKLSRLLWHLLAGLYIASAHYPSMSGRARRTAMRRWSRRLLDIVEVRVRTHHPRRLPMRCMIVSNHVSWLDIFVISARYPAVFVAKSEIRGWPVIGNLCARAGTIFIERGRRTSATRTNSALVSALEQGIVISIFPEGRTTDGRQVGHFHQALFQPAIDSGSLVQPVLLQYLDLDNHYSAAPNYVGDMSLLESIWKLVSARSLVAHLSMPEPIPSATGNRRILARDARTAILDALNQATGLQPGKPSGLPDAGR